MRLEQLEACKCSLNLSSKTSRSAGRVDVGARAGVSRVRVWRRQLDMQILSLGSSPGCNTKLRRLSGMYGI